MSQTREEDVQMAEELTAADSKEKSNKASVTRGKEPVDEEEIKEPPAKRQKTDDDENDENQEEEEEEEIPFTAEIGGDKLPFTDGEAEQVLAKFMETQNRPYGVQDLLNNFQHQLTRPQCLRVVEILTESSILTCKEYGKAKVYLINQDLFPETNNEQLAMLDEQGQVRMEEHSGLDTNLKTLKAQLKVVTADGDTN